MKKRSSKLCAFILIVSLLACIVPTGILAVSAEDTQTKTYGNFRFIALVGTPVVSVIATDLEALCRTVEERTGIRTVSVDTSGMELYDVGERKARKVIEKNFPGQYVIGDTPLDSMPDEKDIIRMSGELKEAFSKLIYKIGEES